VKIELISIDKINPAPYNPRKNLQPGDPEYEKLKKSIQEFDLVEPLVWNKRTGNLVGGHQRLKIIQEMGHTEAHVSVVDLDDRQEKALNIALNKISGEWDMPLLRDLLEELKTGGLDMELTGFGDSELNKLMTDSTPVEIEELLSELDMTAAIEKPIWVSIRTSEGKRDKLEAGLKIIEKAGIRVERSYD
jgi:ParB-like chromosome segregation protein Spo0J